MTKCIVILLAVSAIVSSSTSSQGPPPFCTNLTGWWCCESTNVTQTGSQLFTTADYGIGNGSISGLSIQMTFSNDPSILDGLLDPSCSTIQWNNSAVWTRSSPPWPGPAVPIPSYARNLTGIYEINPRTFNMVNISDYGVDGSGSGTFASVIEQMPYLSALGINGIWLAGYSLATHHFYGIWSVYAARRPDVIDPLLGSAEDFKNMTATAHSYNIKIYLDIIGHGLTNDSDLVLEHPDWFLPDGSWGMVDYNYSSPGFLNYWTNTWLTYAADFGIDGARVDIADPSWWPSFDTITLAAQSLGIELLIFGEGSRYHFSQHDVSGFVSDLVARVEQTPQLCYETVQFSCHDSGWESAPGNYYAIRGSRANMGYSGIFSPYIPLWLGGEEYDEDPVLDLPSLQEDLYGQSGKPGGWMYGSIRQLSQASSNTSKANMLADVSSMLAIVKEHADVLHKNKCETNISRVNVTPTLELIPYARYLFGEKVILVFGNTDTTQNVTITANINATFFGFPPTTSLTMQTLFPPTSSSSSSPSPSPSALLPFHHQAHETRVSQEELLSYPVTINADLTPGGGITVMLLQPQQQQRKEKM